MEDKINEILEEANSLIYKRLKEKGIPFDANTEDAIYIDDSVAKKTYYITTAALNECDEYGGED